MPQNPTRQVHAVLAGFVQDALINNQNHNHKTDKIIARTLLFSKNQNCDLCFDRLNNRQNACWKNFAKQTRTMILENLTLPKTDNAKKTDKILQTQLARNFAIKDTPILRTYKTNRELCEKKLTQSFKTKVDQNQSKKPWSRF